MRSGERRGECGKEAAARAALKDGELEAAAQLLRRLWRGVRRRQWYRGSGAGRGARDGGGRWLRRAARRWRRALEGGE